MDKIKLELVIPTYNRPECIRYMLKRYKDYFERGYEFLVSIYDSSTNDDTSEIVQTYNLSNIKYSRISADVHVDRKTMMALKASTLDYVMLCGDGHVVKIDALFKEINFSDGSEVFLIYDTKWEYLNKFFKKINKFQFDNKDEFFKYHFWQSTLYGGTICKKELFQRMDVENIVSRFGQSCLIYPASLVVESVGPFTVYGFDLLEANPFKTESGWQKSGEGINIWTRNLYNVANKLNDVLSQETIDYIIKNTNKNNGFLTARGLMSWRISGSYSLKIYNANKFYIKKCKACSGFSAFVIAITPKFVLKIVRKIYRLFKRK